MNYRALQVSVALLFAMAVAACGPSPESCEFWKDKLNKMDKVDQAVREVGDKKCKDVFKELEKVWDTGRVRDRVLQAVKKINDPKGAQALIIKALGDTRSGAIAAYLVRDWKIKAAVPQLQKVVKNDAVEPFVKAANLKALLSFGKKEHEDFLIEVLKTNPDQQGILLNRIAAQTLGEIRSTKAVPYLINALFMEQGKQNAYGEASLALVRMAKEAAPQLIKSFEGKNEVLRAFAKKNRIYDFVVTWKLIVMARDMKRKEFGPYLYKALTTRLKVDNTLPTKEQGTQEQVWLSTLTGAAIGLAYLGDTSYVEKLKDVLKDKDYGPRIKMQAIVALTHLAGPASVEFLAGLIRDMRDKNPKKDRRFRTLRYNYFGPLSKIADYDGTKLARKLIEEETDAEVKRGMMLSEPLLEVAEFCKNEIDCWKRLLYFDVDTERANCRKDEKKLPVEDLDPAEDHDAGEVDVHRSWEKMRQGPRLLDEGVRGPGGQHGLQPRDEHLQEAARGSEERERCPQRPGAEDPGDEPRPLAGSGSHDAQREARVPPADPREGGAGPRVHQEARARRAGTAGLHLQQGRERARHGSLRARAPG